MIAYCAHCGNRLDLFGRRDRKYCNAACKTAASRERRSTGEKPPTQVDLLTQSIRAAYGAQMRNRAVTHNRRKTWKPHKRP